MMKGRAGGGVMYGLENECVCNGCHLAYQTFIHPQHSGHILAPHCHHHRSLGTHSSASPLPVRFLLQRFLSFYTFFFFLYSPGDGVIGRKEGMFCHAASPFKVFGDHVQWGMSSTGEVCGPVGSLRHFSPHVVCAAPTLHQPAGCCYARAQMRCMQCILHADGTFVTLMLPFPYTHTTFPIAVHPHSRAIVAW